MSRDNVIQIDSYMAGRPDQGDLASVTDLDVRRSYRPSRATVLGGAAVAATLAWLAAPNFVGADSEPEPTPVVYEVDCSDETITFTPEAGEGFLDAAFEVDVQAGEGIDEYTANRQVADYLRDEAETPAIYYDRSYELPENCVVTIQQ